MTSRPATTFFALRDCQARFKMYMRTATELGERTQWRYDYEVGRFVEDMENRSINDVSPQDLLIWNARFWEAGSSTATVKQKHAALKKFFQYLDTFEKNSRAKELLEAFKQITAPRRLTSGREPYALTPEQVGLVLEAVLSRGRVGRRDHAIVTFLWAAGLRIGEVATVPLAKLDLQERRAIVVGKGLKEREVFFDSATAEELARWLVERATWRVRDDTVFISADGYRLDPDTISEIIREAAKRAGLPKAIWAHLFRHTRATELLEDGMDVLAVAEFLGHSDINTTKGYHHQDSGRLRDQYDKAMAHRQPVTNQSPRGREN